MKNTTRSLLEELELLSKNRDVNHIIENRAANVIASAIHLLEVIQRNFDSENYAILERKLLMAIKNKDKTKFTKALRGKIKTNENK